MVALQFSHTTGDGQKLRDGYGSYELKPRERILTPFQLFHLVDGTGESTLREVQFSEGIGGGPFHARTSDQCHVGATKPRQFQQHVQIRQFHRVHLLEGSDPRIPTRYIYTFPRNLQRSTSGIIRSDGQGIGMRGDVVASGDMVYHHITFGTKPTYFQGLRHIGRSMIHRGRHSVPRFVCTERKHFEGVNVRGGLKHQSRKQLLTTTQLAQLGHIKHGKQGGYHRQLHIRKLNGTDRLGDFIQLWLGKHLGMLPHPRDMKRRMKGGAPGTTHFSKHPPLSIVEIRLQDEPLHLLKGTDSPQDQLFAITEVGVHDECL